MKQIVIRKINGQLHEAGLEEPPQFPPNDSTKMSQNQSYFWQTTRHNVYLKRSAKWHMALALMVVLTFGTICAAESQPDSEDNAVIQSGIQSVWH